MRWKFWKESLTEETRQTEFFKPGAVYHTSDKSSLPSNAVRLSPAQLSIMEYEVAKNWKNKREIFSYLYAPQMCGSISAATGLVFTNHLRQSLKLSRYGVGRLSTYASGVFIPFALTGLTYHRFVSQRQNVSDKCQLCAINRGVAIQLLNGFLQPMILTTTACFAVAKAYKTIALPAFWDLRKQSSIVTKIFKSARLQIGAALLLNVGFAVFFTIRQREGYLLIKEEILKRYSIKSSNI
ncbi:DgyrCDS318 [Dimorphilus gyrociliatus]|uniref:DgyrCDS318 n=1 Tax=Dimorphilus gyrociliatus TaxID=2664684 RepID=A0A7I8V461_9ANNE|nr:DgyrCDS318 [Dimorphilus gyrociliatus]